MISDLRGGLPVLQFDSPRAWEEWLEVNQATAAGAWLKIAKKDAGVATCTYAEALEVALCYGWIDGQKGALDARFWLQRFTRRGPRSKWSCINREKAGELMRLGRMRPAGLAAVASAQADGRWDAAYESQSRAQVPEDLQRALDARPAAKAFFATLDSANRYAILYRIAAVKRPATRERKIAQYVELLEQQRKLHP